MLEIRRGYRNADGSTGLRQADAAALADLTQSKISRAEQGTFTLKPEEARRYGASLRATSAQIDELVELTRAAVPSTVAGQARLMRRGVEIQRRIQALESQSQLIRSWQPTIVPGMLQTWDYTVALIEFEPDSAWASQRLGRVALLDDETRDFHHVISEAVLCWVVGSPAIMKEQLEHLLRVIEKPNITVDIVPFGQTVMPPPESSFHLYERRAAVVSTDVGTTFLDDRGDLDTFAATFDRLVKAAAHGLAAREIVEAAIRRLSSPT